MREIIAGVLGSSVPVIGYVAPSDAHAASAGACIPFATHIVGAIKQRPPIRGS
jgi:membrane-bound serine protease (ClpP class)